jgi:hypothetical protein
MKIKLILRYSSILILRLICLLLILTACLSTGLVYADTKDVDYNTASHYTVRTGAEDKIVVDNGSSGLVELVPIGGVELSGSHSLWGNVISVWHMDNDAWDDPKGGNDGSIGVGDPSFTISSKLGTHAGSFDGDDSVVTATDSTFAFGSNPFSIGFWFKYDASSPSSYIISWGDAEGGTDNCQGYWAVNADSGGIRFGWVDIDALPKNWPSLKTVGAPSTIDEEWHHIVVTRDGSNNVYIYIDGINYPTLFNGETLTSLTNINPIENQPIRFAHIKSSGGYTYSKLTIDEVAIFNKALSLAEIQTLFLYPPDKPYVKYDIGFVWQPGDIGNLNSITPSGVVGTVEYSFEIDGVDKWWNGSEWITNSGEIQTGDDLWGGNLVGLWHINETNGGLVSDSSGNDNDGIAASTSAGSEMVTDGDAEADVSKIDGYTACVRGAAPSQSIDQAHTGSNSNKYVCTEGQSSASELAMAVLLLAPFLRR